MIKWWLLFISMIINHNCYATHPNYVYFHLNADFTEETASKTIQQAFDLGIRFSNTQTDDTLLDFYNYVRYGTRYPFFAILLQGVGQNFNGVVFRLDPDANFYPLRQTIHQAISRITAENDRTGGARRLLQEELAHLADTRLHQADTRLIVGFPSASSTTRPIGRQTIISATVYRNGVMVADQPNPNYVPQAGASPTGYPFQPSPQIFPVEPIEVAAQGSDYTYATRCNASTQFPESNTRPLSFSASPKSSLCAQAPESISADEYLKRVNRHHVRKLQPALSFLLLG